MISLYTATNRWNIVSIPHGLRPTWVWNRFCQRTNNVMNVMNAEASDVVEMWIVFNKSTSRSLERRQTDWCSYRTVPETNGSWKFSRDLLKQRVEEVTARVDWLRCDRKFCAKIWWLRILSLKKCFFFFSKTLLKKPSRIRCHYFSYFSVSNPAGGERTPSRPSRSAHEWDHHTTYTSHYAQWSETRF